MRAIASAVPLAETLAAAEIGRIPLDITEIGRAK